ncbi:glycerophosphoryl diester phosphodiesterase membrane domain-containing protein [Brachybacterium hainanense]|uniref:Glycerophosphoryl diester phosphodiesterase membrane domain-containing protein n=1 Tax=Brachybacterium hainanense TaxID=1541174 RepID=A0ABV6RBW1_9MICO
MSSPWSAPGSLPAPQTHADAAPELDPSGAPASPLERELTARVPLFPLRPMSLGEILSAAMRIYRVRPRTVFGLSALVFGLAFVITSLLQGAGMIPMMVQMQGLADDLTAELESDLSLGESILTLVTSVATGLVTMIAAQLVTVVLARVALDEATGRRSTEDLVPATLRRRGLPAVVLGLLVGIASMVPLLVLTMLGAVPLLIVQEPRWWTILPLVLGALLGLLGTLYISFRCILAVPVLAAEEVGALGALRRSLTLTRGGRGWRVIGIGVLITVLYGIAQQAVGSVFGIIATVLYLGILLATNFTALALAMSLMLIVAMFGTFLATVLVAPFLAAGITALYADARMRGEGWDVELQAAARGERAAASPSQETRA